MQYGMGFVCLLNEHIDLISLEHFQHLLPQIISLLPSVLQVWAKLPLTLQLVLLWMV